MLLTWFSRALRRMSTDFLHNHQLLIQQTLKANAGNAKGWVPEIKNKWLY
jgi:hypothetical protein